MKCFVAIAGAIFAGSFLLVNVRSADIPDTEDPRLQAIENAWQRRLEYFTNFEYEVDIRAAIHFGKHGVVGKEKEKLTFRRCRGWHDGLVFRIETDVFAGDNSLSPLVHVSNSRFDGVAGVAKSTLVGPDGTLDGRIDTQPDRLIIDNRYFYWMDSQWPYSEEHLFRDLLRHRKQWSLDKSGSTITLVVPYQPYWETEPGGSRRIEVDAEKGYLPISGESHWQKSGQAKKQWRIERFRVVASQQIGDQWMPKELYEEIAASPSPETVAVYNTSVTHQARGDVSSADLEVTFAENMRVVDAIRGVTYKCNALGEPAGAPEPVLIGNN